MSDTISKQSVLDALNNIEIPRNASWYQYYQQALTAVDKLPPAQPEPSQVAKDIARIVGNGEDMRVIAQGRIRGRWIPVGGALYQCDQCGVVSLKRKFCSECGADMREVTE